MITEKKKKYMKKWCKDNKEHRYKYGAAYWRGNKRKFRGYELKKTYNITLEDYDRMALEQNNKCAICGKHQSKLKRVLSVDHCHKTNKIRGLLCGLCNAGLGNLRDSIKLLKLAIKYLERTS